MSPMAAVLLLSLAESADLPPLVVTGRDLAPAGPESVDRLGRDELGRIRPTHPSEVFARLPGTWITRGSGQEHLTAIRSPILTGPGACGAFLVLEDGVPVRPPGFCNINTFMEIDLVDAAEVSVLRGPGGIGHASGGLHGVVDVRTPPAFSTPRARIDLEAGSNDYRRVRLEGRVDTGDDSALRIAGNFTDSGSFRLDEDYEHRFMQVRHDGRMGGAEVTHSVTGARLDQNTAGYVLGEDSYLDPDLRRSNPNPEAFREATALRAYSRWRWLDAAGGETRLTGYLRRSYMTFRMHFLPGKPLERNDQTSGGLQFDRVIAGDGITWKFGADLEAFTGGLSQVQATPTVGPPPLAGVRPVGGHYDYTVDGQRAGGYLAAEWEAGNDWTLTAGLNGDWIRYDYETLLPPGNEREDGTECNLGGCLYNRPADRDDDFVNLAPEITLSRRFDVLTFWLRAARGYRAPQATELYRLQRGQDVADLDSVTLDAVEAGLAGTGAVDWEVVAFAQHKRNEIFEDAEGFNVSDGKTGHYGIEFQVETDITDTLSWAARGTWARHEYRFDRDPGGEVITDGNRVPSAPEWLGGSDLTWYPGHGWQAQLAWEHTGAYWLDAANTRRYPGHDLWHVFVEKRFGESWSARLKVRNLFDDVYAERADFAFGNHRYFPGARRTVYVSAVFEFP